MQFGVTGKDPMVNYRGHLYSIDFLRGYIASVLNERLHKGFLFEICDSFFKKKINVRLDSFQLRFSKN